MGYIDLKKLNLDELVGVVNLYPWFGGARVELCRRMSRMGADIWGVSQFADAAMYVGAREKVAEILHASRQHDWSDNDMEKIIKSYIAEPEPDRQEEHVEKRKVYVVGGDYFSQAEYDKVRDSSDNVFSRYAAKAQQDKSYDGVAEDEEFDLYTETLAQIYAEQGYYEKAKNIYSKLLLAYPEKNTYFAALIEKLNELN